jgi:hypothetical protein
MLLAESKKKTANSQEIVFNNKIKAFLKLGFYLHHSGHVCHRVIVLCLCTVSS